jgi:phosphatidylserine/phosphatidylglycerophosphate/cardiolipin synthase-like enzyme
MPVKVSFISNCDDAVIFWRIEKRIPDCWGFAIERELKQEDGKVQRITLANRMGFKADAPKSGDHKPSTSWPFQRFWWADYAANLGDVVRYRVTPMVRSGGMLQELVSERSGWTGWTELSGGKQDGFSSFFNRGLVISQFMARYLEQLRQKEGLATRKEALAAFKETIGEHELPIRNFLSGALRIQMLELLGAAKKNGQHVYGALYELEDDELVEALSKLGARAHIVLANGSITKKKEETSAEARKRDQNKTARAALNKAKVEVFGRFLSPGALGHNKFLVFADKNGKANAAWTGSTNWTSTGLCTQINNGLLIKDRAIADEYLQQWGRLRDAKSAFPKSLVEDNTKPKVIGKGKNKSTVWFTRTSGGVDLAALDGVLNEAKDGILFLMFQPGGSGALGTVRKLQEQKKSLYIKGVVSTLPPAAQGEKPKGKKIGTQETEVRVQVVGDKRKSADLDIVQPTGIRSPFASWAATVTRDEFITGQGGVIGFAIVHSKLIVIDPFTNPIVVTGSHNFSGAASTKNDENFVIVRGNEELATHYAAHILSVYQHYSWMAYLSQRQAQGHPPTGFLREEDTWQDYYLKNPAKRELDFWAR